MDKRVDIRKQSGWVYYLSSTVFLSDSKCGKWMYFFNDKAFVEEICYRAVNEQVVSVAKHSDCDEGVACFYLNIDDLEAHKRVIEFFIYNRLIRKTKSGRYYNNSYKLDSETYRGQYSAFGNFTTEIKLDRFIDLKTGQWIMDQKTLNRIIPFELKLYSMAENIPLRKDIFGSTNACEYIKMAFPSYINTKTPINGNNIRFFEGEIPKAIIKNEVFYIVRFRAVFHIKRGREPFLKCKTSLMYPIGKPLETSDVFSHKDGKYYDRYIGIDGKIKKCFPEFSLTRDDYNLFNDTYDIIEIKVLDGCYFE